MNKEETKKRRQKREYNKKEKLEKYIVCPLCLKESNDEVLSRLQLITSSHLKKHNYTTEKFKKEYPECYVSHDEDKIIWENEFDLNNYVNMISTVNNMEIVDTNDIVYCRCCLKPFKRISSYHLESHNMSCKKRCY